MFVLFDVGANWGTDSLARTRDNSSVQCYAFEPTPELALHLYRESMLFRDRYFINRIALSDYDGAASFNVSAHGDWDLSSLHEYSADVSDTWKGRGDIQIGFDRKIDVQVSRLDTWFKETKPPIDRINFFHCDTQGSDLAVLRGMGDHIGLIHEGVVETPQSAAVRLYEGQFQQEEMRDFLSDNGFDIIRVESQQNEDNLYFRKR